MYIQYNTIQYIQHNTIQRNTIQYNTIQYNTIQHNTTQYNTDSPNVHSCFDACDAEPRCDHMEVTPTRGNDGEHTCYLLSGTIDRKKFNPIPHKYVVPAKRTCYAKEGKAWDRLAPVEWEYKPDLCTGSQPSKFDRNFIEKVTPGTQMTILRDYTLFSSIYLSLSLSIYLPYPVWSSFRSTSNSHGVGGPWYLLAALRESIWLQVCPSHFNRERWRRLWLLVSIHPENTHSSVRLYYSLAFFTYSLICANYEQMTKVNARHDVNRFHDLQSRSKKTRVSRRPRQDERLFCEEGVKKQGVW